MARHADWPQPFRYIDFPEPAICIKRLPPGTGGDQGKDTLAQIEISVEKPAKCVVLSIREDVLEGAYKDDDKWGESVQWEDNALDLFPGEKRIINCRGLTDKVEIWAAYMGRERAFKVA